MIVAEHYLEEIATKLNLDIDHVREVSSAALTCWVQSLTACCTD